jgi:hypothetical protein
VVDLLPPILIIFVLCCVIFFFCFWETYGDHTRDFKREQDPSLVMPLESEKLTKQGQTKTSTKRRKVWWTGYKVRVAQIQCPVKKFCRVMVRSDSALVSGKQFEMFSWKDRSQRETAHEWITKTLCSTILTTYTDEVVLCTFAVDVSSKCHQFQLAVELLNFIYLCILYS